MVNRCLTAVGPAGWRHGPKAAIVPGRRAPADICPLPGSRGTSSGIIQTLRQGWTKFLYPHRMARRAALRRPPPRCRLVHHPASEDPAMFRAGSPARNRLGSRSPTAPSPCAAVPQGSACAGPRCSNGAGPANRRRPQTRHARPRRCSCLEPNEPAPRPNPRLAVDWSYVLPDPTASACALHGSAPTSGTERTRALWTTCVPHQPRPGAPGMPRL